MWSELFYLDSFQAILFIVKTILTRFTQQLFFSEMIDLTIGKQLLMWKKCQSFKMEILRWGSFVPCGKFNQNDLPP